MSMAQTVLTLFICAFASTGITANTNINVSRVNTFVKFLMMSSLPRSSAPGFSEHPSGGLSMSFVTDA